MGCHQNASSSTNTKAHSRNVTYRKSRTESTLTPWRTCSWSRSRFRWTRKSQRIAWLETRGSTSEPLPALCLRRPLDRRVWTRLRARRESDPRRSTSSAPAERSKLAQWPKSTRLQLERTLAMKIFRIRPGRASLTRWFPNSLARMSLVMASPARNLNRGPATWFPPILPHSSEAGELKLQLSTLTVHFRSWVSRSQTLPPEMPLLCPRNYEV